MSLKLHEFEIPNNIRRCLISYTSHNIFDEIHFGRVDAKSPNNMKMTFLNFKVYLDDFLRDKLKP